MGITHSTPVKDTRSRALVITLAAADTAGGILSIANPEGFEVLITEFVIEIATVSTLAATADFGVAANGTTSSATLIDELDMNAATGRFDNISDAGVSGGRDRTWSSTQYITGSKATGACAGLLGTVIIHYKW